MSSMSILWDLRVLWMPLECLQFFRDRLKTIICGTLTFLEMGSARHKNVYFKKLFMVLFKYENYVQKRLGSRLRSLKKRLGKTPLEDGKPISGEGRLPESRVGKLQVYFGKTIGQNTHCIVH